MAGGAGGGARWLLALAALATAAARPDVVFRAPEVLVRHAAVSKPVGTRAANYSDWDGAGAGAGGAGMAAASAAGAGDGRDGGDTLRYEEFFLEHDVSTADAKRAAEALNLSLIPEVVSGCGPPCSRRELEYCGGGVVGDHCCCERRPFPEVLPFVPHSCYVGPRPCRPRARDCAAYARLRVCCCAPLLARKWKAILSGAAPPAPPAPPALLAALLLLTSLRTRRTP